LAPVQFTSRLVNSLIEKARRYMQPFQGVWFTNTQRKSLPPGDTLARIIHEPLAAIAYLTSSPGLGLIADLDVLQYACARLTALSPGSNAIFTNWLALGLDGCDDSPGSHCF
jgi:hypothetical protein